MFDKCSRQFGYLGRQLKRYFNLIWAKDKYTFHLCFHLCILTWVPESIHMYTHTHTHIQIYTCVFVYVIVCWCMCAYTFVCPAMPKKHEKKRTYSKRIIEKNIAWQHSHKNNWAMLSQRHMQLSVCDCSTKFAYVQCTVLLCKCNRPWRFNLQCEQPIMAKSKGCCCFCFCLLFFPSYREKINRSIFKHEVVIFFFSNHSFYSNMSAFCVKKIWEYN